MSRFVTVAIATLSFAALGTMSASAQYYSPVSTPNPYVQSNGGFGFDHGIRHGGINPKVGFGVGPIGAGVGSGFGLNGAGAGANVGFGPLGVSTNAGLSRNGIGARGSAGIANTGAAFEGGVSNGGVGVGANARVFGFGSGASVGLGNRGPSLGASVAFGPIGTLLIGSHRNSFPGAQQTRLHTNPSQQASYYSTQHYGNAPYYTAPQQAYAQRSGQSLGLGLGWGQTHMGETHLDETHLTRRQFLQNQERTTRALSQCAAPWIC